MPTTLVLGGARSGKSSFVEQRARRHAAPTAFVATALPIDGEMASRIDAHRASRPAEWTTIEEPLHIAGALSAAANFGVVVVDCLTVWLANALHEEWDEGRVIDEIAGVTAWLRSTQSTAYVVSNEVGLGIVPMGELSRAYRDLLGRVNAAVAAACDRTLFFAAGRAVELVDPESIA